MTPAACSLRGRRILVTRPKHQAGRLSRLVRRLEGEPVEVPLLEILPPADWDPLDRALRRAGEFTWIVFTSRNAVRYTLRRLAELELALPPRLCVAAVGPVTARALAAQDVVVQSASRQARWQALVEDLSVRARRGAGLLLPRSERAGPELPAALRERGFRVADVVAYRTVGAPGAGARLRRALAAGPPDAVIFTSASAVEEFAAALAGAAAGPFAEAPRRPLVACIGPNTAAVARSLGLPADVVPRRARVEALVAALGRALAPRP